tara:strand:- start:1534 stop:3642 length:2109 start_codon:yes stop_codon:yes gene_type:complete
MKGDFNLLRKELNYLETNQLRKIESAFEVALSAHAGQKRVSGDPYIIHPIAVTKILADYKMDYESIIAGLLHDVIEDTAITKKAIQKQFGVSVAHLVDGLSKIKQVEFKSRLAAQGENFRKMLLAMSSDIRVIVIKLADRLHNMRTLEVLSKERKERIATETLEIFSPIARRLGMHDISLELEDLSFKALYPKRYAVLSNGLTKIEKKHQDVMEKILNKIRQHMSKADVTILSLFSRKKNLYSIYRKMKRKHVSFSELTDVYAARVILKNEMDCYKALGVLHQLYYPLSEKFKDYIAVPKPNGYQSLHTVLFGPSGVPIEVQIRTQGMEERASSGIASHWQYKIRSIETKEQKWLENLIDIQKVIGNPEEFIKNVKMDLFSEEVFVFTPKGDIIELPQNATAMDFAYNVHTEIGNHCIAAKIDRQLAPLSSTLANGQTIEILTSDSAHPTAVWLDIVVTPKAKTSIHNFLKSQQKKESIALGRELLEFSLNKIGLSIESVGDDQLFSMVDSKRYQAIDEFYASIGMGTLSPHKVIEKISSNIKPQKRSKVIRKTQLPIKGTEGMVVKYAKCCYPIPGDPIMGILTSGQGMVVHCENCPQILSLREDPQRCVHIHWSIGHSKMTFEVKLMIRVVDHRGVLADITTDISKAFINIINLEVQVVDDKQVDLLILIGVTGRKQLADLIRQLRKIRYVERIQRTHIQ